MDNVTSAVAQQYTDYAYPRPISDLAELAGKQFVGDPVTQAAAIWPEGRPQKEISILVAGCGTNQAAWMAFNNPECQVFGLDLSPSSIAHERYLKDKHKLDNLRLHCGDILDVGHAGLSFDYITATNVLHHMPNPDAGLRALASVLNPTAPILCALYGCDVRHGIYMLQDVCRQLGIEQTPQGIAMVKLILGHLPKHHHARAYLEGAGAQRDLSFDAGIVDTFLHAQDRAYTVPEVLRFVEDAGLVFQGWANPELYSLDVLPDTPLKAAIATLPEPKQWAVLEKLLCRNGRHIFFARR